MVSPRSQAHGKVAALVRKPELAVISTIVAVLATTLLAALLRFYKLGEWSFWSDEIATVYGTNDGFNSGLFGQPLTQILVQRLSAALGTSEWSSRLGPAVIGIVSVPLLYVPTRRVFGGAVAAVASVLVAISPWHIYWSQSARFYVLLLLLCALSLFLFYFAIEQNNLSYLALSMVLLVFACRERLLALMMLPVFAAHILACLTIIRPMPSGVNRRNTLVFFGPISSEVSLLAGRILRLKRMDGRLRSNKQ